MPAEHVRSLPELGEWQTELLRLTVFRPPGERDPGVDLWQRITGDVPDSQSVKPKTSERQEAGAFGEGKLLLQVDPIRLDWFYFPDQNRKDGDRAGVSFPASLELFCGAMKKWLVDCSSITRMAFGAVLRLPVADRGTGYRRISELLPFNVDPGTSSDFLYQINKPLESTVVAGLKINRLSKWSVGFIAKQSIEFNVPNTEAVVRTLSQDSHCRIELDINTAPEPRIDLPEDKFAQLFDELVELGLVIVQNGDQS